MPLKDLTGQTFGRLYVVARAVKTRASNKQAMWVCKCTCGQTVIVDGYSLRSGRTKSCGCYQAEKVAKSNSTHGKTTTKLYAV